MTKKTKIYSAILGGLLVIFAYQNSGFSLSEIQKLSSKNTFSIGKNKEILSLIMQSKNSPKKLRVGTPRDTAIGIIKKHKARLISFVKTPKNVDSSVKNASAMGSGTMGQTYTVVIQDIPPRVVAQVLKDFIAYNFSITAMKIEAQQQNIPIRGYRLRLVLVAPTVA